MLPLVINNKRNKKELMEFKVGDHVKINNLVNQIGQIISEDLTGYKFLIKFKDSELIYKATDLTLYLPEKWAIKTDRQEFYDWVNINKTEKDNICRNSKSGPYINSNNGYTSWFGSDSIPNGYTEITFEYWCRVHRPDLLSSLQEFHSDRSCKLCSDKRRIGSIETRKSISCPECAISEEWCVRRKPENAEVLNAWTAYKRGLASTNQNGFVTYQGYTSNIESAPDNLIEITYEQWQTIPKVAEWLKKNYINFFGSGILIKATVDNREIEGYKAPFDMFCNDKLLYIRKGDVLKKGSFGYWNESQSKCMPAEWVETWEPVYKETLKSMNWENISNNEVVIKLLKEREELEALIRSIDEKALINYEIELLNINTPKL